MARHSMNPKNQSILHSLTTVEILLINRIHGPHYAASAAPGPAHYFTIDKQHLAAQKKDQDDESTK